MKRDRPARSRTNAGEDTAERHNSAGDYDSDPHNTSPAPGGQRAAAELARAHGLQEPLRERSTCSTPWNEHGCSRNRRKACGTGSGSPASTSRQCQNAHDQPRARRRRRPALDRAPGSRCSSSSARSGENTRESPKYREIARALQADDRRERKQPPRSSSIRDTSQGTRAQGSGSDRPAGS